MGPHRSDYRTSPKKLADSFVYDDGVVKGFIRVNGTEIEKLFVEPAVWGRGIGGRLMEFAAAETGADRLLVLEKNVKAIRFYERHGFALTAERQPVDDTDEYLILMKR